jgi:hypothetical protein
MSSLDNAETFFGHYEDAVAQDKDMAIHRQNIAKIQRESAATVERHHADLAARAEQRAQGQTSTPPGHRA